MNVLFRTLEHGLLKHALFHDLALSENGRLLAREANLQYTMATVETRGIDHCVRESDQIGLISERKANKRPDAGSREPARSECVMGLHSLEAR